MNKSKFLKKSLAAVLAVLLIAAMIPLSAAAVDAPPVSKITVGGVEATGTGIAREVNLVEGTSLPKVVVQLDANNGGNDGSVWHDDGTGTNTSNAVNTGAGSLAAQWTFTLSEDEYKDGGEVKFRVFHENNVDFADYVITLHFVDGSADNSLKSIGFTNGDNQYGSTTQDENGVYIITAKYGTITPGTDSLTVELGSADATLTGEAGLTITQGTGAKWTIASYVVGTPFNLQVKSQNGELANYQAKVVAPTFFKSISTPNEYKAAEVDLSASPKTIDLYIPFGTKQVKNKTGSKTFYEIPVNFETGYPSAVIKTLAYDVETQTEKKELKSGDKIYIDVTAGTKIDLDYIYNGTTETFKVEANITNDDPAATISAVKVGNYMAKLEGTTFTLELPASFMDLAGSNATALNVKAAMGSTVTLAGSNGADAIEATVTDPTDWTELTDDSFDASKEATYTLRVVSGETIDGKTDAKDYTLVVKKVAIAEEAAMKAMVLENSDGKQFPAEISGNTIKFKLPYSGTKAALSAVGKEWKLYYDVSSGAYVRTPADLIVSGEKILAAATNTIALFPVEANWDGKTAGGTIEVVASDNSSKTYNVVVEKLPAATGHSIVKFGVTHDDANKLDDVDKNDIFEATPSGTNVIINVPFSKYGDFASGSKVVPVFELSEGAKIYRVAKATNDIDNDLTKVELLTGVTADAPGAAIETNGAHFDGTAVSSSDSTPKSLCLFVISEGATDPTVGGFTSTWKQANAGKYTEYKLQVKKAAANKTVKLDQVKLFNNLTKEEVIGTVNNAAETITFNNIPNHFMANATANHVYLDYKVSKGEGVTIDATSADKTKTFIAPIVYGDDGKIKTVTDESGKKVAAITTTPANTSGEATGTYGSLYIESEDGEVGNGTATQSRVYTIKYNVAPAEAGAALNSVTINGVTAKPDANNKVTITLPMATEITSLKPTFNVSKYASIHVGNTSGGATVVNGESSYNFSSARTFTVVSEDTKNTNTYTVEVKISNDFTDVKPGDWFYSYVMDAVDRGIIIGNGDGTFGPHTNVTRAQFATMMARVDGFDRESAP